MGVVPASKVVISGASENELRICFTPIHGVDSFGVESIDDDDWSFLISEIPDL